MLEYIYPIICKLMLRYICLEVPGPASAAAVDAFVERFRAIMGDKTAELRVMDLKESVTPTEVVEAIAAVVGYFSFDIKVVEIRKAAAGLGTV